MLISRQFVGKGSNWQQVSIGSGYALVLNNLQPMAEVMVGTFHVLSILKFVYSIVFIVSYHIVTLV